MCGFWIDSSRPVGTAGHSREESVPRDRLGDVQTLLQKWQTRKTQKHWKPIARCMLACIWCWEGVRWVSSVGEGVCPITRTEKCWSSKSPAHQCRRLSESSGTVECEDAPEDAHVVCQDVRENFLFNTARFSTYNKIRARVVRVLLAREGHNLKPQLMDIGAATEINDTASDNGNNGKVAQKGVSKEEDKNAKTAANETSSNRPSAASGSSG